MADLALATANKVEVLKMVRSNTVTAGADLTAGMACRLDTNGHAVGADGGAAGTADVYGITCRPASQGDGVTLLQEGVMAGWDLAAQAFGAPVYVSDTGTNTGTLGDVAGTAGGIIANVVATNMDVARTDKAIDFHIPAL